MSTLKAAARQAVVRRGRWINIWTLVLLSGLVLLGLGWSALLLRPEAQRNLGRDTNDNVRVYCAAGVAKPVQALIGQYNEKFNTKIEIARTGGSGELAGQIATEFEIGLSQPGDRGADLFISADDQLLDAAVAAGHILERFPLARQIPVIAVRADSDFEISTLADLVHSKVRFGIASSQAAVGKFSRLIAQQEHCLDALENKKKTESENVMTLAQSLVSGGLDAAIIWDTTVAQINQQSPQPLLKILANADPQNRMASKIEIGVVSTSIQPTAGLRLARFLTAPETGSSELQKFGFQTIPGDAWEEVPEVHVYFGSMFTPVLEEKVRQFATREGVNVYPRWEGCGKLVAAMKSIQDPSLFPDGYMACDLQFVQQVESQFETPTIVSSNEMVMAVSRQRGAAITRVDDLLTPGLRIGICDPEQSALGLLTQQVFSADPFAGWYQTIQQQASVTVDVGPTLISQLLAGGLDVAIVYRSNVEADPNARQQLKILSLDRSPLAKATQTWTVAKTSQHAQLMSRLFQMIRSSDSQDRFTANGFRWELPSDRSER